MQDPGKKFNAQLAQLLPTIKDAIADAGPLALHIKQKVVDAGAQAAKKDYAKANALLDQAGVPLKGGCKPEPPEISAVSGGAPQRIKQIGASIRSTIQQHGDRAASQVPRSHTLNGTGDSVRFDLNA